MRKLFLVTLIIAAAFIVAPAQEPQQPPPPSPQEQQITTQPATADEIRNMGKAPTVPNGIGRLDARVFDSEGNPVRNAYVELESNRTDGYFCESWSSTDERGVAVLPPIHMGRLTLIVKAKGFKTQKVIVPTNTIDQPVRVTLVKK
ncbi:MAG: carboxypeptidase-like regulatory domain-containing protein [Pyrinomonadaceae bacterium]|nr:carboxypeptidase-like regulatory domain-containing protein [Acidobacteriota bacterium]